MDTAKSVSAGAELTGKLSLSAVVAFGLSYMAPTLVMVIFGIISVTSGGTSSTVFLVATLAMLVTALSYAAMARIYPVSGSAYFYARRVLGSGSGFLIGWSVLLDYLFLPMVSWLTQSILLNAQFPDIPIWAWLLLNAAITTVINILGVTLADRVNRVLLGLSLAILLVFFVLCVFYVGGHGAPSPTAPLWNAHTSITGVTAAAAIAAYSFLGFDAVTTLSEETRDARRTIPRAVVLVVAIGGTLFVVVSYVMQLVHPGAAFDNAQASAYLMSVQVGGITYANVVNLVAAVAGVASCLAVQLSSSRLIFIMGRDGVLPNRIFGRLNAKTKTPVLAILATACMAFVGLGLDLETATGFINFGAFLAFTAVNVCVIAYYIRNRTVRRLNPLRFVLLPAVGACVTLFLLAQLNPHAILLGVCWLALGFVYLVWLTRAFRRPAPEMDLVHETALVIESRSRGIEQEAAG